MRRNVSMLILCLALAGCATTTTMKDSNATPADKRAAVCADAQAGYAMADAAMSDPTLTPEASKYWTAYKLGILLVIKAECISVVNQVPAPVIAAPATTTVPTATTTSVPTTSVLTPVK